MTDIAQQLRQIQQQIRATADTHQRPIDSIQLIAVSKTQSASKLLEAYHAGQRAFGENYLQEAKEKQSQLQQSDIEWHFIGPIQSNKTRDIAESFQWVHSVDRLKIAQRLSAQRPEHLPPLNICIQLNIDKEDTKSGVLPNQLVELAQAIAALPRIRLRGLMSIPRKRDSFEKQQAIFKQVAELQQQLNQDNPELQLDTLSMGMSADIEAAIAAGTTMIRVGTGIFGKRH